MSTRYQFVDDSGETRLAGTLVPDPGVFVPSRNIGQCEYDAVGQPLTLAAATELAIPWEVAQGEAGLLSLAVPTAPAPVADGAYAVTVTASIVPDAPPDPWFLKLQMDIDWFGQTVIASETASGSSDGSLAVSQTWFCSIASALEVHVRADGGATLASATMYVQRLT